MASNSRMRSLAVADVRGNPDEIYHHDHDYYPTIPTLGKYPNNSNIMRTTRKARDVAVRENTDADISIIPAWFDFSRLRLVANFDLITTTL